MERATKNETKISNIQVYTLLMLLLDGFFLGIILLSVEVFTNGVIIMFHFYK